MILTVPISETTHTPQGDGNLFDVHAFLRTRKQPTPRKGTETAYCSRMFGLSLKQPPPRKGTETFRPANCRRTQPETTHTPQGDGNPSGRFGFQNSKKQPTPRKGTETQNSNKISVLLRKQPTPRKGAETSRAAEPSRYPGNNPHPARGRKPLIARGGGSALTETTHTPQGDGKPFVFTLQKLLEKPFTSPTGDN